MQVCRLVSRMYAVFTQSESSKRDEMKITASETFFIPKIYLFISFKYFIIDFT